MVFAKFSDTTPKKIPTLNIVLSSPPPIKHYHHSHFPPCSHLQLSPNAKSAASSTPSLFVCLYRSAIFHFSSMYLKYLVRSHNQAPHSPPYFLLPKGITIHLLHTFSPTWNSVPCVMATFIISSGTRLYNLTVRLPFHITDWN